MDRSWDMFQVDDGLRLTRNQQKENQETGIPFDIRLDLLQYLVGGFNPSEKYESQWEGLSHIIWKNKKCSKPPTSIYTYQHVLMCWYMGWYGGSGKLKFLNMCFECIQHYITIWYGNPKKKLKVNTVALIWWNLYFFIPPSTGPEALPPGNESKPPGSFVQQRAKNRPFVENPTKIWMIWGTDIWGKHHMWTRLDRYSRYSIPFFCGYPLGN